MEDILHQVEEFVNKLCLIMPPGGALNGFS